MKDDLLSLISAHISSLSTKIEEEGDERVLRIFVVRRTKLETLRAEMRMAFDSPELCRNFREQFDAILTGEGQGERIVGAGAKPTPLTKAELQALAEAATYYCDTDGVQGLTGVTGMIVGSSDVFAYAQADTEAAKETDAARKERNKILVSSMYGRSTRMPSSTSVEPMILEFVHSAISAKASAQVVHQTDQIFRGQWLEIFEPSLLHDGERRFTIREIRVGNIIVTPEGARLSSALFPWNPNPDPKYRNDLAMILIGIGCMEKWPIANTGQQISLEIFNESDQPTPFKARLHGLTFR